MDANETDWSADWAAAQAWWREAGVDLAFADQPTAWLTAPAAAPGESPQRRGPQSEENDIAARGPRLRRDAVERQETRIGGNRAHWPATLDAFGGWWLTEPSLDCAPAARRVLPRGPAGAALMVLVAMPEAEDRGELLSGPQGRLLDAILAAFGSRPDAVYRTSALPCPGPAIDWAALAEAGMTEVLTHHIALAAPQRLIVFGRDVSPLLRHDPAQSAANLTHFEHDDGRVPLLVAPSLAALIDKPALKRALWRRWLDWTGT